MCMYVCGHSQAMLYICRSDDNLPGAFSPPNMWVLEMGLNHLDRLGSKCSNLPSHLTGWTYLLKASLTCIASICERPINLGTSVSWKSLQTAQRNATGVSPIYQSAIQDTKARLKDTVKRVHTENVIPRWRDHTRLWGRDGREPGLHWLTSPFYLIIKSTGNLYDNLSECTHTRIHSLHICKKQSLLYYK